MPDDTLTGLDEEWRGRLPRPRRSLSSGGAIYHLSARTSSRGKGQSARAAAAYIQRAAEYRRDQGAELVYTESGHMPAWAEAEPTSYWDAADLYERANGRLCNRLEFALPLALSEEERRELAVGFAHHLTDAERLPYTLAIHAGNGSNPHCHLMISERGNDGVERAPEQWFKRFNAAAPDQGGARKSTAQRPPAWLEETREAWAEQTNQALERAGHEIRIDHRSLEAQGVERLPSVHLGPTAQAMEARRVETARGAEARRREEVNAERERGTVTLAQVNAALAGLNSQQEAAAEAVPQEPSARALPPSRWETLKERVGAWLSREQAPEALPTPPAAQDAPAPAQDGPRPSSPALAPAEAQRASSRGRGRAGPVRMETEQEEDMQQRDSDSYSENKNRGTTAADVMENYEYVAQQVAQLQDPNERAKAERLLETIRREETERRESRQQERERDRERERARERDEGLER